MATKIANVKGATGVIGPTGPTGPRSVSTDAGNTATLGSDSFAFVPALATPPLATSSQNGLLLRTSGNATDYVDGTNHYAPLDPNTRPTIYSVRLNQFNAIVNPNFAIDQRNVGTLGTSAAGTNSAWIQDRWTIAKSAATGVVTQQQGVGVVYFPGTSQPISYNNATVTVTTPQATLAAGEYLNLYTTVEAYRLRPLLGGSHTLSLVAYCTNAITFNLALSDPGTAWTYLSAPLSLPANTWTYFAVTVPNWTSSFSWKFTPGVAGYQLRINLGAGSTFIGTANAWLNSNVYAPSGVSNFLALPANSYFSVAYVQHEPGGVASLPMDTPWYDNLVLCQRYFAKSNPYNNASPTSNDWRSLGMLGSGYQNCRLNIWFPVEMAAVPSVTIYDNGLNANKIYLDGFGSTALTGVQQIDTTGVGGASLSSAPSAAYQGVLGQWRAQTSF